MALIPWNPVDSFPHNLTDLTLTSHRPCPVCGADQPREILHMNDFQFFTDSATLPKRTTIREVQCTACYALYLNPAYTPRGFEVLFAEAGCSYGSTEGRPQEQIRWLTERGLLNDGGSILDVGCYDGRFLSLLPATVRKIGVDIDKPAIERGRLQYGNKGIELIHGDFDRFKLDNQPDAITMFHVLEHLPDPVATLANLRSLAAPTTRLVVEVPILENGFTNDINGFFSVQHMTHFSRRSLANALARAGWAIETQLEQPDYNGCRVLCRPTEAEATVAGEEQDCTRITAYIQHHQKAVKSVQEKLTALAGADRVLIWGGGMHTEFLYQLTNLFRVPDRQFVIIDSDPLKQGKSWRGVSICSADILHSHTWGDIPLVISSYGGQPAIAQTAIQANYQAKAIIRLYQSVNVY